MFKKIFLVFLILYLIATGVYFVSKYMPSKKQEKAVAKQYEEQDTDCPSFAIGHIAGEDFRINTRLFYDSKQKPIDENNIREWIAKNSCDKAGTQALIYYNSKPVAIAEIQSYDYSKPFAEKSNEKPILYTVLKPQKKATVLPNSGYIVAVFNYDQKNIDFYDRVETEVSKEDESLIAGSSDTIYYEVIGKDPSKTEIEYNAIKTDLNTAGDKLICVLSTWNAPELSSLVRYLAIYNIHKTNNNTGSKRYQLFPINKVRNSKFDIFQVIDLDNDGYKETIIKKERESFDTFTLYDYDVTKDLYTEKLIQ